MMKFWFQQSVLLRQQMQSYIIMRYHTLLTQELNHFGIDPEKLENYLKKNTIIKKNKCINKKTKKTIRAIIVVHVFGHPAKLLEL